MAGKGRNQNLVPFKPGQSGNPAGRGGVLPPEIRAERKRNQAGLIQMITRLLLLPEGEVKKRAKDKTISQLEKAAQALVAKAKKGDVTAFRYAVELMTGKIPEHDYDGYSEEDLKILNRVKEIIAERASQPNDPTRPNH